MHCVQVAECDAHLSGYGLRAERVDRRCAALRERESNTNKVLVNARQAHTWYTPSWLYVVRHGV